MPIEWPAAARGLVVCETAEVRKEDGLALGRGQAPECPVNSVAALAPLDFHVGKCRGGELLLEAVEHRLTALGAAGAAGGVDRTVAHDREDPPAHAPARAGVRGGAAPDGEEGVLDHLLGDAVAATEALSTNERGPSVAPVDQLICVHVTTTCAFEQGRVRLLV